MGPPGDAVHPMAGANIHCALPVWDLDHRHGKHVWLVGSVLRPWANAAMAEPLQRRSSVSTGVVAKVYHAKPAQGEVSVLAGRFETTCAERGGVDARCFNIKTIKGITGSEVMDPGR